MTVKQMNCSNLAKGRVAGKETEKKCKKKVPPYKKGQKTKKHGEMNEVKLKMKRSPKTLSTKKALKKIKAK